MKESMGSEFILTKHRVSFMALFCFVLLWLLGTASHTPAQAGLELTMLPKFVLDLWQSFCFSLPSTELTNMGPHAQFRVNCYKLYFIRLLKGT